MYTDPAWALDRHGETDPSLATIEREVYGEDVEFSLGLRRDGRFLLDGAEFDRHVAGADALVVYRARVSPRLLDAVGPSCRLVARQGVGLDNLNAELLRARGLWGFHVPDYCGDEVSTHTLALALALERGVCVQDQLVRDRAWDIHAGRIPRRTAALTAGIVGFGRIGRATSRKLHAFYGRTVAHDPYIPADLMASHGVVPAASLAELFAVSDVVVLHTELTAETERLVDEAVLRSCRPGALLVNTARGGLVDLPAVLAALRDGRLGGFASDVFSPEDPNDDEVGRELLRRPDVIVTAHRAFLSAESELSLRRRVAAGVRHVLREGQPPPAGRVA
ncbi:C-terminal binding protein [Frankia sp. AgB32]|uniref:C-terminal binding protein n=1 Tax=Frankia sp. AgB32 TaxID=631119 RepID=UPI00200F7C6B|nr:C-terminal binding protein [Frankia sp. AgB32]MCK9896088.1 C-terminal binding protein [Frankia sp. AgB32]